MVDLSDPKKTKTYGGILLTVIVSLTYLIVLVAALISDSKATEERVTENTQNMLISSAEEQARTFYMTLKGQYTVLEVLASAIGISENTEPAEITPMLREAEQASQFFHIILDLPDGTAHLSNGLTTNVYDRDYFTRSMAGERSIEYVKNSLIGGSKMVILSVPIWREGAVAGVLHGSYEGEYMNMLLAPASYAERATSFVIDDQGDVVIAPGDANASRLTNFLSALNDMPDKKARAGVCDDLANGRAGHCVYPTDKGDVYAVYAPFNVRFNDSSHWFIVNEVPVSYINDQTAGFALMNILLTLMLTGVSVLTIGYFVWREAVNKKRLDAEMAVLSLREKQYRVVATQSRKNIFRYDIKTRTSIRDQGDDDGFGKPRVIENVPESVIDLYAEESRDEYREFYRKIHAGEPTASVVSRMRDVEGNWRWVHSDATVLFDSSGAPLQAIVSYYDVTEQREKELLYQKWIQDKAALLKDACMLVECDLTHDKIDHFEGDAPCPGFAPEKDGYSESVRKYSRSVSPDDRNEFLALTDRKRLTGAYYNGEHGHSLDYRVKAGENARWKNIAVQLMQYPDTNDIKAFAVITDIDEKKRADIIEKERFELDHMTSALNRMSFLKRFDDAIAKDDLSTHALIILDIDDFKQINDTLGHQNGDSVLIALVRELRACLRESDIIGRIGGDEFMIFLRDVTRESARDCAEAICRRMLRQLSDGARVTVSLGVSLYPSDGRTFTELYRNADTALYAAKGGGKNNYAFFA